MNGELIDSAWRVLPNEFKEEVKKRYKGCLFTANRYAKVEADLLEEFFGINNLTSDAEGEEDEMLCVPRRKVIEVRNKYAAYVGFKLQPLYDIFGSKCLLDDGDNLPPEPKPAEPKFKKGDIAYYACSPTVKHKCAVTKVMQNEHSGKWEYNVMFEWGKPGMWIPESDLEPYTGPKNEYSERIHAESVQESRIASEESHLRNLSQSMSNCDKHFDTILKDSFSKERRLNIAASIAAGWLACHGMTTPETIAMDALAVADALIIEVKKTNNP